MEAMDALRKAQIENIALITERKTTQPSPRSFRGAATYTLTRT